jgi:8-oxo-dGTP diphosphatase
MKQIDVAIAVIFRDEQVLICQRKKNDTFGGFWEFPGGKCETGESLEACLLRELREELDIDVQAIEKLTTIRHDYPNAKLSLHPFLCQLTRGEPKLIECQKLLWIPPADLRNYRFPPANHALLDEVARRFTPPVTPSSPATPSPPPAAP